MTIIRRLALPLAALLLLAAASGASAATIRYASATASTGLPCTSAQPCTLEEALENPSGSQLDVKVLPGTYGSPGSALSDIPASGRQDTTLEAADPAQRPLIYVTSGTSTAVYLPNGSISGIDFRVEAGGTVYGVSAQSLDRVSVIGAPANISCLSSAISNSLCVNTADSGVGAGYTNGGSDVPNPVVHDSVNYTNITAWDTATGGRGIYFVAGTGLDMTVTVHNSIVKGDTKDIYAYTSTANSAALAVTLSNSTFATVDLNSTPAIVSDPSTNNNVTSAPLLVDPAGGDFHELAGSPTVDHGDNAAVSGGSDLGGLARIAGAAVDIGAFEFPSPSSPPPAPIYTTISNLKAKSRKFTIAKSGAAFRPAAQQPRKKKGKKPVGTLISFNLSQADSVRFTLQRAYIGRRSGSSCVKATRKNKAKKKCTFYKDLPRPETVSGVAGANTIWWTGRWQGKALSTSGAGYSLRGDPIKANTGNEPGTLNPRPSTPIKLF